MLASLIIAQRTHTYSNADENESFLHTEEIEERKKSTWYRCQQK